MSRRKRKAQSKNTNLVPIFVGVGVAVLCAAVVYIGMQLFLPKSIDAPMLDIQSYTRNSKEHQGNAVKVIGTIKSRMTLLSGETLLEVTPETDVTQSSDSTKPLGLFVSEKIREKHQGLNLDVNDSYIFISKVSNHGHLVVEHMKTK